MINIFPEFESRQVLTADELNWMACYLDTQERQSRRFLIGCGLIGGLQVKLVSNSVQITHGIGVTSAGHIVSLAGGNSGFTTYTKQKPYTQQANEKLACHYLPDQDPQAENYAGSADQVSLYFPGFTGQVLELFEDTVNDATPINGATLNDKVVMLFAEIIQKELKDCENDNCQERGKKYLFKTKVLVISKEDALLLLGKEYNNTVQSEDVVSRLAYPWLHLPNINILKPVFSNKPVDTAFSEKVLVDEYTRCIRDFLDVMSNNKTLIEQALTNLRNYCTVTPANVVLVDKLVEKIKSSTVLGADNQSPSLSGVVYDYLWCFVKAYQELQAEAQQLKAKCFTNEDAFPNHILLGLVSATNSDFDSPVYTGYSIYRHYFQSRLTQTQQAETAKKVIVCIKRLVALVTAFDDAALPGKKDIRITTGGSLYDLLSAQTMPYYLKQTTMPLWNVQSAHTNLNRYNTTYDSTNDNQAPSASLPYNTLPYAMQGNHAFFRIEGVYGQQAVNALNSVFRLRKKHGMAFEVLMLRLNEKAPFSHSFNYTINEDVESMYQVVRAEVLKQISLNVNYLYGLQLKAGKFNSIRSVLEKELERSYLIFLGNLNITLLANQPLQMVLPEAVIASNITTNYKAKAFTTEAKYQELEKKTAENRPVSQSLVRQESLAVSSLKYNPAFAGILDTGFNFGVLLFNTLGNLVDMIKKSDHYKATTNISFYSHLLKVVKGLQKNEQQKLLFLHALQLYCALKLHEEYLAENFLELDIVKYQGNLEDELLPACDQLMNYLRPLYTANITNDEILYQVNRNEMMEFTARTRYDDDWIKIIQLDAENRKRNGGLGVENLLEKFVKLHPGIAHGCGVPEGGTYLMIYDAANQVVADFYLPYIISSHLRPIQFTLLENKTITLSGTVKNATGELIAGATLLINGAAVMTDQGGRYRILVTENSTVRIICSAVGYENFSKDVAITNQSKEEDIVLQPVQASKFTTTITFFNQLQQKISREFTLLNKENNKKLTVKKGVMNITEEPQKKLGFVLEKDPGFDDTEFEITTIDKDQAVVVQLIEMDFFRIQLIGEPGKYIPSLLSSIKVIEPEMDLDISKRAEGLFITKQQKDITQTASVLVVYNQKTIQQNITPGPDANKIFVDSTAREKEKKLPNYTGIMYPDTNIDKYRSVSINGTGIPMDLQSNIGKGDISSSGDFDISKEFPKVRPIGIGSFGEVQSTTLLIDYIFTTARERVTDDMVFSFTGKITATQKKSLVSNLPKLRPIAGVLQEGTLTFYCMVIDRKDFDIVSEILKL
ncbi:MAG: carboxypeptidase-like regulatory domain-containing protein [Chitinophagaceae bacterium]|nr:carboxypeptidase-like regulatory domain-containing protein [Chitinophagaceae bacterium]